MKYAIKSSGSYLYKPDGRVRYDGTQKDAQRFATVNAALTFITKETWQNNERELKTGFGLTYLSSSLNIVRIEETAGAGETRRALTETEVAKVGEVVKYALGGQYQYAELNSTDDYIGWNSALDKATLWGTATLATTALVTNALRLGVNPNKHTAVVRIAVKPNEPVITETVLA